MSNAVYRYNRGEFNCGPLRNSPWIQEGATATKANTPAAKT